MVTSMYAVKQYHGGFDGESDTQPDATFDLGQGYVAGFHLLVEDGTSWVCLDASLGAAVWNQDTTKDRQIQRNIIPMNEVIVKYCNNTFAPWIEGGGSGTRFQNTATPTSRYDTWIYTSASLSWARGDVSILDSEAGIPFSDGDCIQMCFSYRDDAYYTAVSAAPEKLDVDRPLIYSEPEGDNLITIYYIDFPDGIQDIAARMVEYNVYQRKAKGGLASESVGNYSYTNEAVMIGGLSYPASVVAGIDVYRRPVFS